MHVFICKSTMNRRYGDRMHPCKKKGGSSPAEQKDHEKNRGCGQPPSLFLLIPILFLIWHFILRFSSIDGGLVTLDALVCFSRKGTRQAAGFFLFVSYLLSFALLFLFC